MFTCPTITQPEVNGFGWNLGYSEYSVWSWPDRFWVQAAQKRERESERKFFFCPVINARLYRFPPLRSTRRGYERWWILSDSICENLPVRGPFSKKVNFCVNVVNDCGLQAAISAKWLQILESHDWLACLLNVGFTSVPLESTQSHSPGLQAAYLQCFDSVSWVSGGTSIQ